MKKKGKGRCAAGEARANAQWGHQAAGPSQPGRSIRHARVKREGEKKIDKFLSRCILLLLSYLFYPVRHPLGKTLLNTRNTRTKTGSVVFLFPRGVRFMHPVNRTQESNTREGIGSNGINDRCSLQLRNTAMLYDTLNA